MCYNSLDKQKTIEKGEAMTAVLCGINSKYIHVNLAVRYIKAYCDTHCNGVNCVIAEETINTEKDVIIENILKHNPQIVAFSCYIWNIELVLWLCNAIKNINSSIRIILGGPEVSFNPEKYLDTGLVDYVQCGDGERPMATLFECIAYKKAIPAGLGICYKNGDGFVCGQPYCEKNLENISSPYTNEYLNAVKGRIAYIETTRGCPFSCAFCLSGRADGVRFFPDDYVFSSIMSLWGSGAKTIKFIDRTFNANRHHAEKIVSFIIDKYPTMPDVCFHFEIAADILRDELIKILNKAPKGLFQVEVGLQSFNGITLEAVMRRTDVEKVCENVKRIAVCGNIHTHIDLIAGLPFEDYECFRNGFNRAFGVGADMLQLGFLKLLHGSKLRDDSDLYDYTYSELPPYEIVSTKWMSKEDMERLKAVDDANDKISNSGRFKESLAYVLEKTQLTPFDLLLGFGKRPPMSLDDYTNELFEYFSDLDGVDKSVLRDKMCLDRLRTNKSGRLPKSLKIMDKRLADIAYSLEINQETSLKKGVKRAICILYSQNRAVYADYTEDNSEIVLNYIKLD